MRKRVKKLEKGEILDKHVVAPGDQWQPLESRWPASYAPRDADTGF